MSKLALNYWLHKNIPGWKLMGFVSIDPDSPLGITASSERVVPLFVFKPGDGWGDTTQTSAKYPWVLFADGGDDSNYYLLFGQEKAARECAEYYIENDLVIDFIRGEYKGRKWLWQN